MASVREEAAPSFTRLKLGVEQATQDDRPRAVERLLEVARAIGSPMIDDMGATFIFHAPTAHHVEIAGEFNEWGRGGNELAMQQLDGTGLFYRTLQLQGPARFEYKLIVDGEWRTDPLCPNLIDNGIGGQNSWFALGDFQEPPELKWNETIGHGRVIASEFTSDRLGNRRAVRVYTPAVYDSDPALHLSALYVHDGGEYLERARLNVVLDNLIAGGAIAPLIAVMIDPVDRMREYWCNEDYAEFFCDELMPVIESQYRIGNDRRCRAVMGASLGGLISVYLGLTRPKLFGAFAGQSSAIFLEEEKIAALLGSVKRSRARVYLDVGEYEPRFIAAHERLVASVKKRRWPCQYQRLAGGHNWTSWRAHLRDLLTFLFPGPAAAGKS
jgi:enterochelin esterase-like enzyme